MRKSSILLLLFSLFACSKEKNILEFDEFGVSNWEESEFVFDRHYSLLDTITAQSYPPSLRIMYDDGNAPTVLWTYNGETVDGYWHGPKGLDRPQWDEQSEKWEAVTYPIIDYNIYNDGGIIRASIKFKDGTQTIREMSTKENKTTSDFFGINVSMTKSEIKKALDVREFAPNVIIRGDSELGEYLLFDGEKLTEIGEVRLVFLYEGIPSLDYPYQSKIAPLGLRLLQLGFDQMSDFSINGIKNNRFYEWDNGKIIVKLQGRDALFFPLFFPAEAQAPENFEFITLSYKKKPNVTVK
jgi:hypothetical protein